MLGRSFASLLGLLFLPCTLAAQQTFIVDIKGGGDFTQIQPAVDAASAGDIVRVRHGVYLPVTISKGIRLLGDARGSGIRDIARIQGVLDLRDLPRSDTLILAELNPSGTSITGTSGDLYLSRVVSYGSLLIENAEYVNLHRCYFSSSSLDWQGGITGAVIRNSRVFDTRSRISSAYGLGLSASDSQLVLVKTSVSGGSYGRSGSLGATIESCEIDFAPGTRVYAGGGMFGWYWGAPLDFELSGVNRISRSPHSFLIGEEEEIDSYRMDYRSGYLEPHLLVAGSLSRRPIRTSLGDYLLDPAGIQILFEGVSSIESDRRKFVPLPSVLSPNVHVRDKYPDRSAPAGSQWLGIPITFQALITDQQGNRSLSLPYTIVF